MRNEADALAFRTEKLIADNAETLPEETKAPVVEAIAKLKEALTGDDNDAVKAAMDDLNTKAATMGQAMYAAAQAKQQAEASAPTEGAAAGSDDEVVDAEIVDEDGKDDK
jgi:molecular chaperone DnaK